MAFREICSDGFNNVTRKGLGGLAAILREGLVQRLNPVHADPHQPVSVARTKLATLLPSAESTIPIDTPLSLWTPLNADSVGDGNRMGSDGYYNASSENYSTDTFEEPPALLGGRDVLAGGILHASRQLLCSPTEITGSRQMRPPCTWVARAATARLQVSPLLTSSGFRRHGSGGLGAFTLAGVSSS